MHTFAIQSILTQSIQSYRVDLRPKKRKINYLHMSNIQ